MRESVAIRLTGRRQRDRRAILLSVVPSSALSAAPAASQAANVEWRRRPRNDVGGAQLLGRISLQLIKMMDYGGRMRTRVNNALQQCRGHNWPNNIEQQSPRY